MNPSLDSELLRTFVAVAETGNLTRAGERVSRTQSAVSMQIKRLEDSVGDALFLRGSRGVELTAKGAQLLTNARRIVALIDETAASLAAPPLEGKVRLGIPEEYGYSVLVRALSAFGKVHPDVEISARYGKSSDLMRGVAGDSLDLAVVFEWQAFSLGEVLMTDPTVWATSDAHPLHEERTLPIAIYDSKGWCTDFALQMLEGRGIPYRVAYRSETGGGLKVAVMSGLAVAPLSRSNIPAGCRELTAEDGFGDIDGSKVVMHRNPRSPGPAVEAMSRAIRDAFASSAAA
ncbi:MAG: LysR family transcriptional regulator [Pseudomonadota bacterium]|nr:LysR family transcriptional regulator [Pseudomonadota bacterium]